MRFEQNGEIRLRVMRQSLAQLPKDSCIEILVWRKGHQAKKSICKNTSREELSRQGFYYGRAGPSHVVLSGLRGNKQELSIGAFLHQAEGEKSDLTSKLAKKKRKRFDEKFAVTTNGDFPAARANCEEVYPGSGPERGNHRASRQLDFEKTPVHYNLT